MPYANDHFAHIGKTIKGKGSINQPANSIRFPLRKTEIICSRGRGDEGTPHPPKAPPAPSGEAV